ncbi:MAG TPA: hypothetical protein VN840_06375 [Streptosporangiaceae bacterium]|nr:hypothetical protein [Streptosporangiaceae bacterium]
MSPADLSAAEQLLWQAFPVGSWVDLRTGSEHDDDPRAAGRWPQSRAIRAEVLTALLLGAAAAEPGRLAALRLRGVRITGRLDLMGGTVGSSLICEHCHFDSAPRLAEAVTRTVRIIDSYLPGFNGARMRADGMISLNRTVIRGVLILDRARISGEVCARNATVGAGADAVAIAADGLSVSGDLDVSGATCLGAVRLRGAQITGWVNASAARFSCASGPALDADNAVIGGSFTGRQLVSEGRIKFQHARIGGHLQLVGARLENPGDWALAGGGITVEGGVWCSDGFAAAGEIRLIGARLSGNLTLSGARLSNPGGIALNLDSATLGDFDGTGLIAQAGQLSLVGTHVAGRLNLDGAELGGVGGKPALIADGAVVGRTLVLADVRVTGAVSAYSARVGGQVILSRASIDNPDGTALSLAQVQAVDVLCDDLRATGTVLLTGARVGRQLRMTRVRLASRTDVALDARAVQAQEFWLLPAEPIAGDVLLSHSRLGIFRDDQTGRASRLQLDGLTYEVLEPQLPARQRLRWLTLGMNGHQPQPFEQLAAMYTSIGEPAEARRVLYARERHQRAAKTAPGRAWSLLQDVTVGYGYQPWRAALWFAVLLALGSAVFAASPPRALSPATAPHFNPVAYSLDLLLPLVDLGQKHAFDPTGADQWFSYLLIAAGWILATAIAAAAARIIRRE